MNEQLQNDLERDLRKGAAILASGDTGWEMVNCPEPILYVLARRAIGSSNAWIPGADLVEDLVPLRREDSNLFNPHGWFGKELTDVRGGKKRLDTTIGRWAPFVERSEKQPYKYRFVPELYQMLTHLTPDVFVLPPTVAPPSSETRPDRPVTPAIPSVESTVSFIYETHIQEYIERSWQDVSRKMDLADFDLMDRDCGAMGTADIVARSRNTGEWIVIELKRTNVVDVAIGQVTRYMSWLSEHRAGGAPVRGVLVGREFDEKTRYSARMIPGLTLWKYAISFNLEPVHSSASDAARPQVLSGATEPGTGPGRGDLALPSQGDPDLGVEEDSDRDEEVTGTDPWRDDFGPMETVSGWISTITERIVPKGSRDFALRVRIREPLSNELAKRALTPRAMSLSQEQRLKIAGNMIDWVNARWTHFLGGLKSKGMESEPGALVDAPDAPEWLREFTRTWTRRREANSNLRSRKYWSFGRRS